LPLLKRLLKLIGPYKKYFLLSGFAVISLSFLAPLRPYLISEMVEKYIIQSQDSSQLLWWSILIVSLLLLEGGLQVLSTFFSNLLAQSLIRDLRKKVFAHILSFRTRFFDKNPVGALVTRVVSDLEAITEVFSAGLMEITGDIISLVFILSLMFYTDWELALMTLIPIPFLIFATRIFAKSMRESFQKERTAVTALNTFVQEHLSGMSIVQLFNREKHEFQSFKKINEEHKKAHIQAIWANSIFFPVVEFLSSLSIAFLLVWGALKVEGKTQAEIHLMYGEIIAFTLWINQLYRPIRQLADKYNVLQRGVVRAERIFEILDDHSEIQISGKLTGVDFNQAITFDNIGFSYKEDHPVIDGFSLKINPGETIAFVGATGSGKTTLVNLLSRMYEYNEGKIYIGNSPLDEISLDEIRQEIAVVLQDVFLFSGTIMENITLGNQTIPDEHVFSAAKEVGLHDFILSLPGGYQHVLNERGTSLSVGQRQLLSFVRAYVYNPTILVLDEATSSIDNESESLIQEATIKLTKGRTSIVVAHRLSTIQSADRIIVMEKGKMVESGSHVKLMKKEGYYRKLFEKQFFSNEQ
ncbi:MAG: ABC transporter ATP-binding protein, partial [Crocinitomicaceae bacterium]